MVMVAWLPPSPFACQSVYHCTTDDVHTFEGVHYIPIKVIRDKERKWVSASWLSKQMAHFAYQKKKPTSQLRLAWGVKAGILVFPW